MNSEGLKENTLLKILNYIAVAIEFVAIIFVLQSDLKADPIYIIAIHSVSLIWSAIYHIFPGARTSIVYKFLAQTACTIILMLTIINIYMFAISSDWVSSLAYFILLIWFTGPASLNAATLLLLINLDSTANSKSCPIQQVMCIPVSSMQPAMNQVHKML